MKTLFALGLCLPLLGFGIAKVVTPKVTTEHRVVVEVNQPGTASYGLILNNAENLMKAYAPEKVEIEVVCHAEGIKLLQKSQTKLGARLASLHEKGVTFAACANTIKGKNLKMSDLYPFVKVVKAGVWELVSKQEEGWAYLKGGY